MKVGIELDDLKEVMWVDYQLRLASALLGQAQGNEDEGAKRRYMNLIDELVREKRKTSRLFTDIED